MFRIDGKIDPCIDDFCAQRIEPGDGLGGKARRLVAGVKEGDIMLPRAGYGQEQSKEDGFRKCSALSYTSIFNLLTTALQKKAGRSPPSNFLRLATHVTGWTTNSYLLMKELR